MFNRGEIFFKDAHCFIQSIVIFLRIIDDFEQWFHDTANLIVLFLC